jgi:hypothetical protein
MLTFHSIHQVLSAGLTQLPWCGSGLVSPWIHPACNSAGSHFSRSWHVRSCRVDVPPRLLSGLRPPFQCLQPHFFWSPLLEVGSIVECMSLAACSIYKQRPPGQYLRARQWTWCLRKLACRNIVEIWVEGRTQSGAAPKKAYWSEQGVIGFEISRRIVTRVVLFESSVAFACDVACLHTWSASTCCGLVFAFSPAGGLDWWFIWTMQSGKIK